MKVTIEFDTDNAPFEENPYTEVQDVLNAAVYGIADAIENSRTVGLGTMHDSNGNRIGEWRVTND